MGNEQSAQQQNNQNENFQQQQQQQYFEHNQFQQVSNPYFQNQQIQQHQLYQTPDLNPKSLQLQQNNQQQQQEEENQRQREYERKRIRDCKPMQKDEVNVNQNKPNKIYFGSKKTQLQMNQTYLSQKPGTMQDRTQNQSALQASSFFKGKNKQLIFKDASVYNYNPYEEPQELIQQKPPTKAPQLGNGNKVNDTRLNTVSEQLQQTFYKKSNNQSLSNLQVNKQTFHQNTLEQSQNKNQNQPSIYNYNSLQPQKQQQQQQQQQQQLQNSYNKSQKENNLNNNFNSQLHIQNQNYTQSHPKIFNSEQYPNVNQSILASNNSQTQGLKLNPQITVSQYPEQNKQYQYQIYNKDENININNINDNNQIKLLQPINSVSPIRSGRDTHMGSYSSTAQKLTDNYQYQNQQYQQQQQDFSLNYQNKSQQPSYILNSSSGRNNQHKKIFS